jgi:serine/threonine protein kinase
MQRCLSTVELEDLLAGQLEPETQEPLASHLESCSTCGGEWTRRTNVAAASDWQNAAHSMARLDAEDEKLLDEIKTTEPDQWAGSDSSASQASDWFQWDSVEGSIADAVALIRRHKLNSAFPEIPGFQILSQLGRGGMGVVYKARQLNSGRIVALKMILAGQQASAEDLGRFYDEAEAISRLRHPHVVQIFEVGQYEGRLFFVLELIEGGTLANLLRSRPLPARASAQLLESLARAMHYAHERGIVHRDLKPANVLLHGRKAFMGVPEEADRLPMDWDFRRQMPKITDFGLAKMLDHGTGHTSSGDVLGTPSYMAPEQAQGKPYPISATTDVYSLGAILYEMLTGRPPFQGPSPMDTLFLVHTQEPEPPRRIQKDIPAKLEAICLKCLKKNPADRYATAEDLAEDLRHYLEGQPVQAKGRSKLTQGWIRLRQRTGTLIFALLVLLMASIAGGAITLQWFRSEQRNKELQTIKQERIAAEHRVMGLRLDRANADCENGRFSPGLLEMAQLHDEAVRRNDAHAFANAVRRNIEAWSVVAPKLKSIERRSDVPQSSVSRSWYTAQQLLTVAHDKKRLLFAGEDGRVRVWMNGTLAPMIGIQRRNISHLVASQAGPLLLVGAQRELSVWNINTASIVAVLDHPAALNDVFFDTDGKTIQSLDADGTRRTWTIPIDAVWLSSQPGEVDIVAPVDIGDGMKRLAASAQKNCELIEDGEGRYWLRSEAGQPIHLNLPDSISCTCARFDDKGTILATASYDGVRIWDAVTGCRIGPVYPVASAASLQWAEDGRLLARTKSAVWQIETATPFERGSALDSIQKMTGMVRKAEGIYHFLDPQAWSDLALP